MIAAKTIGGPSYPEMIEEMDKELTMVLVEFDRAMNFETLRLANETSKLSFPIRRYDSQRFGAEQAERERVDRERERMERERME